MCLKIGWDIVHRIGTALKIRRDGSGEGQIARLAPECSHGSLLQCIQELHAAAEQRIPMVVLLMNDSGYGAEVLKMGWKQRDPRDAQWKSPDYVAIARGFGGDGVRIEKEQDLAAAIERGMKAGGPFVIDVPISPTLVSDSYSRIFQGQPNQIPLLRPAR